MRKSVHLTPHLMYIFKLKQLLGEGQAIPLDRQDINDIIPHYWREEASSVEEWFIRTCRGLGLHATLDFTHNRFIVTKTRDVAHEATITWPGKDEQEAGKSTSAAHSKNPRT